MKRKLGIPLGVFLAVVCAIPAVAQSYGRDSAWIKSGFLVGGFGQYRTQMSEYTTGYDGAIRTVVKTGNAFVLPKLSSMLGYGGYVGYVFCEGAREPALQYGARYDYSSGKGDSVAGSLDYQIHQIGLDLEVMFPLGSSGFALTGQIGWDLQFFSVSGGFYPSGGGQADLLVSAFVGGDLGVGVAYVFSRRFIVEARAVIRGYTDNMVSGGGLSDSTGGELGRGETSLELSVGFIL